MAVSTKLHDIKAALVAALEAINGTGGYVNTVASINQRTVNKLADVSRGAAELFVEVKSRRSGGSAFGKRLRVATVEISGQIANPRDATDNDGAIFSLDADVEKALGGTLRCGGAVATLTPTGTTFAYGDAVTQATTTVDVTYSDDLKP